MSGYDALVLIHFPPGVSEYSYPHFRFDTVWEVCSVFMKIGISTGTSRPDIKVMFELSYCSDQLHFKRKWTYVSGKLAGPKTAGLQAGPLY